MNVRNLVLSVLVLSSSACADEVATPSTTTATVGSSTGYGTLVSTTPAQSKEDLPVPKDKCTEEVQCDDNDACTIDTCDSTGECQQEVLCSDNDACTTHTCDPKIGKCQQEVSDCDDNDACTIDTCDPKTGECKNAAQDCNDGNFCTTDTCDIMTGCTNAPKGFVPCEDDGNNKTVDFCEGFVCGHYKYWGVRVKAPVSPSDEYYTQLAVTYPTIKGGKVLSNAWTYGIVKNGYAEVDAYAATSGDCSDCICSSYETMDYPVMFTGLYLSKQKNAEGFSAKQIKIPAADLKVFAVYNPGFATEFEVPLTTQIVSEEYDTLPWKMKAEAVMAPELKELCNKE